jgi:hypothetical protein
MIWCKKSHSWLKLLTGPHLRSQILALFSLDFPVAETSSATILGIFITDTIVLPQKELLVSTSP